MGSRRGLAVALAGGIALIGAVTALRATVAPVPRPARAEPVPVVVPYTAPGVTVARLAGPPPRPQRPQFVPGRDTPVLRWAPSPGATAYEVRWQAAGHDEQYRLVAHPRIALSGVPARSAVTVAVAAVDAAGRRSAPLRLASGILAAPRDGAATTLFADAFSSPAAPDRARWRLPEGDERCLARGDGRDQGMLVVGHGCGTVQLRPSVPLTLRPPGPTDPGPDGGRGRIVLVADGPPAGGELVIALLPGDVAGLPPGALDGAPPAAGTAATDRALPAGTVLLRIGPAGPTLTLGSGIPATVTPGPAPVAAPPRPGAPTAWELRVTGTGLRVLRDGAPALTGAAAAVPWRTATAVIAVHPACHVCPVDRAAAAAEQPDPRHRTLLDAVRMTAAPQPTRAVHVLRLPPLTAGTLPAWVAAGDLADATAARLLGWLRPPAEPGPDPAVSLGDASAVALRTPAAAGAAVPVAAALPLPGTAARTGPVPVRLDGPPGTELTGTVLQLSTRPEPAIAAPAPRLPRTPPPRPPVPVARLQLRDAAGTVLDPARPLPAGPLQVGVGLDAGTGQAVAGAAAGYVGIEIELGGRPLLRLPTARDGPAAGGDYRVWLGPAALPAGPSAVPLSVRVTPADPAQQAPVTTVTLVLR